MKSILIEENSHFPEGSHQMNRLHIDFVLLFWFSEEINTNVRKPQWPICLEGGNAPTHEKAPFFNVHRIQIHLATR